MPRSRIFEILLNTRKDPKKFLFCRVIKFKINEKLVFKDIFCLNIKVEQDFQGFEIVFETMNGVSCLQIIPSKTDSIQYFDHKFKLIIKDPVFLNVHNPSYAFHFGQVSIRSLISCQTTETLFLDNKFLCALMQTQSKKVDIGIESNSRNKNTLPDLKANFCHEENSLNHQTCIQQYKNTSYFIIIQPYSPNFDTSIGMYIFHKIRVLKSVFKWPRFIRIRQPVQQCLIR